MSKNEVVAKRPSKKSHPHRSTKVPEYFFHMRNVSIPRRNGRVVSDVTAFVRRGPDGVLYAAFAECDQRDQFCREAGRRTARRKWFTMDSQPMVVRPDPIRNAPRYEDVFSEYIKEDISYEIMEPGGSLDELRRERGGGA